MTALGDGDGGPRRGARGRAGEFAGARTPVQASYDHDAGASRRAGPVRGMRSPLRRSADRAGAGAALGGAPRGLASSRRPCERSSSPTCTSARAWGATSCAAPQPLAALLARARRTSTASCCSATSSSCTEGRATRAMAVAEPVLRAIGARVGADREIVARARQPRRAARARRGCARTAGRRRVDAPVPPDATPLLAARRRRGSARRGCASATPASGSPTRIWATHGHYLDRHLLPESALRHRARAARPRCRATARARPTTSAPAARRSRASRRLLSRWLAAPARRRVADDLAELAPRLDDAECRRRVLRRRLAPLTSVLLGLQMRRASIPALARVVHRLGVDADWVVFGHVHRCGPLPGDDPRRWRGPGGRAAHREHRLVDVRAAARAPGARRRTRTGRAARS